jgi:sortase A
MSKSTPETKQQIGAQRWLVWIAIVIVLFSGVACRLEFGLSNEASAQSPQAVAKIPQPFAGAPVVKANSVEAPQPSPSPTETPTISPTPTQTPTPKSVLVPTTTAKDNELSAATSTPGIPSTPTPIPLIPARYPPSKIIAPAINLDASVETAGWVSAIQNGVETTVWDVPEHAAGWHRNSALPGHGNNVVLTGHHNLGGEVFRELVDLKLGDEILLQADAYEYHYVVTERFIVPERNAPEEQRRQNAQWILPTIDERITLITCWPYTDNSHRLIVIAKPVGFNEL